MLNGSFPSGFDFMQPSTEADGIQRTGHRIIQRRFHLLLDLSQ
jgi:hypothetical protein